MVGGKCGVGSDDDSDGDIGKSDSDSGEEGRDGSGGYVAVWLKMTAILGKELRQGKNQGFFSTFLLLRVPKYIPTVINDMKFAICHLPRFVIPRTDVIDFITFYKLIRDKCWLT